MKRQTIKLILKLSELFTKKFNSNELHIRASWDEKEFALFFRDLKKYDEIYKELSDSSSKRRKVTDNNNDTVAFYDNWYEDFLSYIKDYKQEYIFRQFVSFVWDVYTLNELKKIWL
jgi:hypothetical protein